MSNTITCVKFELNCTVHYFFFLYCHVNLVAVGEDCSVSQDNIFQDMPPALAFTRLFIEMKNSLAPLQIDDLRMICLVGNTIVFSNDVKTRIELANNGTELFSILSCNSEYCNILNIRLLEKLATINPASKKLIKQYKEGVLSRTVEELHLHSPFIVLSIKGKFTTIKEKFNRDESEVTMNEVIDHCSKIEQVLCESQEALFSCYLTAGCIEIFWLLPNDLVEQAIYICSTLNSHSSKSCDLPTTDLQQLFSEISYFKIGDVVIKDEEPFSSKTQICLLYAALIVR